MAKARKKETTSKSRRCSCLRKDGKRCKAFAASGGTTCLSHSPRYRKRLDAARKKGGRSTALLLDQADLGISELDFASTEGLRRILAAIATRLMEGKLAPERARAMASVVGVMLGPLADTVVGEQIAELREMLQQLRSEASDAKAGSTESPGRNAGGDRGAEE